MNFFGLHQKVPMKRQKDEAGQEHWGCDEDLPLPSHVKVVPPEDRHCCTCRFLRNEDCNHPTPGALPEDLDTPCTGWQPARTQLFKRYGQRFSPDTRAKIGE